MFMEPFHSRFPEIAQSEARSIHLRDEGSPTPAGDYLLMESYCTDPKCDCRRVILTVVNVHTGETAATIGFGFDPDDPMRGPYLDPINRQSSDAEDVLGLVAGLALDAAYVSRLEHHYRLMKGGEPERGTERAPERPWWKHRPTKPKRGRPRRRK